LRDETLAGELLAESGGFFLFDIPRDQWRSLDGRTGDIAVLDANGRTIRAAWVSVGFAPGRGHRWFMSTADDPAHQGGAGCADVPAPSYSPEPGSGLVDGGAKQTLPVSLDDGAYLAELPDSPKVGNGPGPVPGGAVATRALRCRRAAGRVGFAARPLKLG
jgi:hypothetical protein